MRKNQASQVYTFMALQADGTAVTTGVTGEVEKDGAAPAAITGTLANVNARGKWRYTTSAADSNGDFVNLEFSGNSMIPVVMNFDTRLPEETAAIKVKTDQLAFTKANELDANALSWAGVATKNGATSNLPQVDVDGWQGVPLPGGANMIENDGSNNGRWTQKSMEQTQPAAAAALSAIHLDHLLAIATVNFPGNIESILGEMLERNTTWRYVTEALSQAPQNVQTIDGKDVKLIPYIGLSGIPSNAPIPTSGTNVVQVKIIIQGFNRDLLDPDESPPGTYLIQAAAENDTGADRSANLGAVTRRGQGDFVVDYTIPTTHEREIITIAVSGTFDGAQYGELAPAMSVGFDDVALDNLVEPDVTVRQSLRLSNSGNGGKTNGALAPGTGGTFRIRDLGDTKDRVQATYDEFGNRTAVTRDLS